MRDILLALFVSNMLVACGSSGSDAEPYDTLQACYDDHQNVEMLGIGPSITVCCIDHPIAGKHPSCGTTQAECEAIVRAGLDQSVTTTEISAACADYVTQLGQ